MGANLSSKLTLDGTQHNQSLRDAVKEVNKYKREVDSANKQLNSFQKGLSSATGSIGSMMNAFKTGDIGGFVTGARGAATAISSMIPAAGGATGAVTGLGVAINTALGPIGWIAAAVAGVVAVVGSAISTVEDFNKSLKGLSALTGVTGPSLKQMGDDAVDLSMKYGTAATDIVDSMKMIGSQAPQLLSDMEGLKAVTENAMVLSKASGGDMGVEETAKALTTVMNQMEVAASESDKIINTLAAGSQKGAADVNYLATAIEKTGTQAKNSGMSYQQLVGTIETLAPKFSSADVAGTALNTLLVRLSTQANDNFNPAIVGLEKALENLDKANLSAADKVKMFGQSGLVAADTLIKQRDALHEMTESVTNTNTAYDQMETLSGSLESGWNKVKTTWDAFMISLGQSASIQVVIKLLGLMMKNIQNMIKVCKWVVDAFNTMVEVISALIKKLWNDYVKPYWDAITKAITNSAIYKTCKKIWGAIVDFVSKAIKFIKDLWNSFLEWLGISVTKEKPVIKPTVDTSDIEAVPGLTEPKGGGKTKTPKAGKTGGSSGSSSVKIEYDTGSLEYYQAQLQKLQKKLTSKKLSLVDIEKTKKEIEDLEKIIEDKEIELGIKPKEGSIAYIEAEISKIDTRIKQLHPILDAVEIADLQIKKEALEKAKKEAQQYIDGVTITRPEFKSNAYEGSSQYASDRVSYYKNLVSMEIVGTEYYYEWVEKLKEWTEKEKQIKLQVQIDTSGADENSLSILNQKVSYYKAQLDLYAYGSPEYEEALKNLKEWTKKAQEIKVLIDLDTSDANAGSLKYIQDRISVLKSKVELEAYGTPEYNKLKDELEAWEKAEHKIQMKIDIDDMSFFEKFDQFNNLTSSINSVVSAADAMSEKFEEGANEWEKFVSIMDFVSASLQSVQTLMQTVNMITQLLGITTQVTSAIESAASAKRIAETSAETSALMTKTSAESGEAVAGATSSGASMPFPYNLIAIALGVAAVIAALASIKKFAGGGIIRGATTMGDYNLARVNGGEMILNGRQQNNLFKAIDSGNFGNNNNELTGKIKIQGSDMYLLLKNYSKEKSKLGKNIGIS